MTPALSDREKITNYETLTHITQVRKLLSKILVELVHRAEAHDATKLAPPELPVFVAYTPKLATTAYDSPAYRQCLQEMRPALEHHYAANRHHPEHFPNGINDMTLLDLIEMLCDWQAAVLRHQDGNLNASIERSQARFGISAQLAAILRNTAQFLEERS